MFNRTILIVEDNKTLALGLINWLEKCGYKVDLFSGGEEALASCQKSLPDLAITNLNLGKMDGPTFIQRLRTLPKGCEVPVMVISGLVDHYEVSTLENLGVLNILTKPFKLERFMQAVNDSFRYEAYSSGIARK